MDEKRQGPGRPPGPLSEAERAQRRAAPWKHGRHAQRPAAQLHHPCSEKACPLAYPCDVLKAARAEGRNLDRCALRVALAPATSDVDAYALALRAGDPTVLDSVIAEALGQMVGMLRTELSHLAEEGLSITEPLIDRDGEVVAEIAVQNPRGKLTFMLAEICGATAAQAGLTRKAKSEIDRDTETADLLGFVAQNAKARKRGGAT